MPKLHLNRDQTNMLEFGALESWDDICTLAQETANEYGELCEIRDYHGDVRETFEPQAFCRACFESPRALDARDSRYCWPCLREFAESASLEQSAPFQGE